MCVCEDDDNTYNNSHHPSFLPQRQTEERDTPENNNFSPTMFNIVSDGGDINQQRFAIALGIGTVCCVAE